MNKELLIRPLLIILMVIIASVILVRTFTSGQTLSEYAEENGIPYHTEEVQEVEKNK